MQTLILIIGLVVLAVWVYFSRRPKLGGGGHFCCKDNKGQWQKQFKKGAGMQEFKVADGEIFSINGVLLKRIGSNLARVTIEKKDGQDTATIKGVTSKEIIEGDKRSVEISVPCLNMSATVNNPT
jgi:hypothetical protein